MQDRPTAVELLQAVQDFLGGEVIPRTTDPRLKYHLLIVLNVLRIVEREVPGEEGRLRVELEALSVLLGCPRAAPHSDPMLLRQQVRDANQELCERIRQGLADDGPWRSRVVSHVRAMVEEKLRINNPVQLEAFLDDPADE